MNMIGELNKGSKNLRQSLPFGAIRKMATVFGTSGAWVGQVLNGNKKGNDLMVECAKKISELHVDQQKQIDTILNKYR